MMTRSAREIDAYFELLEDRTRRRALSLLEECEEPVPIEALADELASELPGRSSAEIAVQLHHVHVPKLAENGLVTHESGTVYPERSDDGLEWSSITALQEAVEQF